MGQNIVIICRTINATGYCYSKLRFKNKLSKNKHNIILSYIYQLYYRYLTQ